MIKKRKIIFSIILTVAFVLLGYCCYMIYQSYSEYKQIDDTYNEVIDECVNTNEDTVDEVKTEAFSLDWNKLLSINSDIVAWIRIPNTNINYPIIQGNSNTEYLHHNIYNRYSKGGCPFVDSAITSPFNDLNTIIYGHNLDNGSMFSSIRKYKNKEYAKTHNIVEIYLPNKPVSKYYVFAFGEVNATDYDVYNIFIDDLSKYYEMTKKYNILNNDENVSGTQPIITLSTCTNKDKNKRYVLQAYLIE